MPPSSSPPLLYVFYVLGVAHWLGAARVRVASALHAAGDIALDAADALHDAGDDPSGARRVERRHMADLHRREARAWRSYDDDSPRAALVAEEHERAASLIEGRRSRTCGWSAEES